MSVSKDVEETKWWMLTRLKADSITFKSDTFLVDVNERTGECPAAQQRKLLESFQADGILTRQPFRGYIQDSLGLLPMTDINKYWKADNFEVSLLQPAFDKTYDDYNQRHGEVLVRLFKDYVDLLIEIDGRQYLLHSFKANSVPDELFDYLLMHPNQELSKKLLVKEELLEETSQPLNIITHKAGFKGRLAKHFMPTNEKNKIQLRPQLLLNMSEAKKIEEDLRSLPFNSAAK